MASPRSSSGVRSVGLVSLGWAGVWLGLLGSSPVRSLGDDTRHASLDEKLKAVAARTTALDEQLKRGRVENSAPKPADENDGTAAVSSKNFAVIGSNSGLPNREVLRRAEELRKAIATKWLGKELPEGEAFTVIHIEVTDDKDEAWTRLAEPGEPTHGMWIKSSRDNSVGNLLAHELTHIVLSTRFSDPMPAWADEGAACMEDDPLRVRMRHEILAGIIRRKQWPDVTSVLRARTMSASELTAYAVSASLAEFLLTRGNRAVYLKFVEAGVSNGWDRALQSHYSISDGRELQRLWQEWLLKGNGRER